MTAADRWTLANDGSELTRTGPFAIPSRNDFEDLVAVLEGAAKGRGELKLVVDATRWPGGSRAEVVSPGLDVEEFNSAPA